MSLFFKYIGLLNVPFWKIDCEKKNDFLEEHLAVLPRLGQQDLSILNSFLQMGC